MLPILSIPAMIGEWFQSYRSVFCRQEGFEWVGRYVTGLLLSPNKTVQGIYDLLAWENPDERGSRRAMHAALFETGWDIDELMSRHRQTVSTHYPRHRRTVIDLDWTFGHHEWGTHIFGVKKRYDYVEHCQTAHQIILTATVANPARLDGVAVTVQTPDFLEEEKAYLEATPVDTTSEAAARQRLIELLHYRLHQKSYRTRTDLFVAIVEQIETENYFPQADYAFDNGVLSPRLAQAIESKNKYWISELEVSRLIFWDNAYQPIADVAEMLRQTSPHSFRRVEYTARNGQTKTAWVFSKVVRLKKYGKKRIFIVHETEDLSDQPRFLITNAMHWEAKRALETWSYRWAAEIFHEFDKQYAGLEAAQVRNEDAVKKHVCLSCVAQSVLQSVAATPSTSEKFEFAKGQVTSGQRCRALSRQVCLSLLTFACQLLDQGLSCEQILDRLIPV